MHKNVLGNIHRRIHRELGRRSTTTYFVIVITFSLFTDAMSLHLHRDDSMDGRRLCNLSFPLATISQYDDFALPRADDARRLQIARHLVPYKLNLKV